MHRIYSLLFAFLTAFASCTFAKGDKNKTIEADEIIRLIDKGKPVELADKIIMGDLDFTQIKNKYIDGCAIVSHDIAVPVTFVKCVFMGNVTGFCEKNRAVNVVRFCRNTSFKQCDFRGNLNLNQNTVDGDFILAESVFRENVSLDYLHIKGRNAHMWEINAEKNFSMSYSQTEGMLNMMDAQFHSEASLQGIRCNEAQFSNMKARHSIDLSLATFNGKVIFNYAQIDGNADLSNVRFLDRVDIYKSRFANNTNLQNTTFYGKTRFNGTSFAGINTDGAIFLQKPDTEGTTATEKLKFNTICTE